MGSFIASADKWEDVFLSPIFLSAKPGTGKWDGKICVTGSV